MILIESEEIPEACQEGDMLTVEVNHCVRVNGKEFSVPMIPDNLFKIISEGGLVKSTIKKMQEV